MYGINAIYRDPIGDYLVFTNGFTPDYVKREDIIYYFGNLNINGKNIKDVGLIPAIAIIHNCLGYPEEEIKSDLFVEYHALFGYNLEFDNENKKIIIKDSFYNSLDDQQKKVVAETLLLFLKECGYTVIKNNKEFVFDGNKDVIYDKNSGVPFTQSEFLNEFTNVFK